MKKEIFSLEGLARLRSADEMDSLFAVTNSTAWMALLAGVVFAASLGLWSVFGVLSTSVEGVGIVVDVGGLATVVHTASGKVGEVVVSPKSRVRKGDIVARLTQPLEDHEAVIGQGRIKLAGNYRDALKNVSEYDLQTSGREAIRNVVCDYDGVVDDVLVNAGDFVTAGVTGVCTIRRDNLRGDLTVVMCAPLNSGKRIQPGMIVQLTPSEADVAETGHLLGVVRSVSLYPATTASLAKNIGSPEVAGWLIGKAGGAAVEVRVDPIEDESVESGYLWTAIRTDRAPPRLTPGSYCSGSVLVKRQAPLTRLFHKLSEWLRIS